MNGKFIAIPKEMLEDEGLKALDIAVYTAIDSFANSDGEAWPSLSTIAERAKVSSATVKRSSQRLQSAGYILKKQRREVGKKEFTNTLYSLPFRCSEVGSGDSPDRTEVGSEVTVNNSARTEVSSHECDGLVLSVQEVGSESSNNYTYRTIPNERDCAERSDCAKGSSTQSNQINLPSQSPQPSQLQKSPRPQNDTALTDEAKRVEKSFNEIWERYPRKDYKGEAKKAFIAIFPAETSPEKRKERMKAINDRFLIFEEESEGKINRGEERYIPYFHNWLAKEGFSDV
ncbi:hypothetical protein AGMMS49957_01700 [Synergistales bacterium]|nr:hypothetical protein AGMMS49957_01700 [Synergistales bacterium]